MAGTFVDDLNIRHLATGLEYRKATLRLRAVPVMGVGEEVETVKSIHVRELLLIRLIRINAIRVRTCLYSIMSTKCIFIFTFTKQTVHTEYDSIIVQNGKHSIIHRPTHLL